MELCRISEHQLTYIIMMIVFYFVSLRKRVIRLLTNSLISPGRGEQGGVIYAIGPLTRDYVKKGKTDLLNQNVELYSA